MNIAIQKTGLQIQGEEIFIFHLQQDNGSGVQITNLGAILLSFEICNSENKIQDIVLGFDSVADYLGKTYRNAYPYFGAVIGRTANRIKNAEFTLNGETYKLNKNLGNHNLHGGKEGFDSKPWKLIDSGSHPNPFITMQYCSREMEEGFPGTLTTTIKYTLRENELQYEITAVTDADTIVNLAQHSYFNLNENGETIESHKVKLLAGNYLEQDRDLCVTGKRIPVKDTIYDFTIAKHINRNWDEETGYDQSFVIDEPTSTTKPEMVLAAECWPVLRQCKLEVYTTESIVHLYTGRWIPDIKGKNGMAYGPYSGLCFETQQHPDGINTEGFPSAILKPGEQYYQKNSYKIV